MARGLLECYMLLTMGKKIVDGDKTWSYEDIAREFNSTALTFGQFIEFVEKKWAKK